MEQKADLGFMLVSGIWRSVAQERNQPEDRHFRAVIVEAVKGVLLSPGSMLGVLRGVYSQRQVLQRLEKNGKWTVWFSMLPFVISAVCVVVNVRFLRKCTQLKFLTALNFVAILSGLLFTYTFCQDNICILSMK